MGGTVASALRASYASRSMRVGPAEARSTPIRRRPSGRVRLALATLAIPLLGLALSGCGDSEPYAAASRYEFYFSATFDDDTDTYAYRWDTAYSRMIVDVAADMDGTFRLEVLDDAGATVFDRTYTSGGASFTDVDTTSAGLSGRWRAIITTTDVDGHVRIHLY